MEFFQVVFALIGLAIGIAIYFLPAIIAHKKNHKQKIPIILVNVFLGWSGFAWAGALVWCFIKPVDVQNVSELSAADEIEKLNSLKQQGIISEEEFAQKKSALLS